MTLQISAIVLVEDHKVMETFPLFIQQCEAVVDEIIVVSSLPYKYSQKEIDQWGVKWMESAGLSRSEALNKAMDQAQGLWILRLDATETLVGQEIYKLQMLANRFEEEGFYFPIEDRSGTNYTVPFETRLFRNRADNRYQGHFVCCLPLDLENKAKLVTTPIFQPGVLECQSRASDIVQGYGENFWLADSMERFHLSVQLANCGLLTEAKRLWEELRMEECLPLRYEGLLYQWSSKALEENGLIKEALDCINNGLKKHPHDVGLYLIKGHLLFLLDEFDAAEELLHHCLQFVSLSDDYVSEPETIRSKAWYALGLISEAKGLIDQAILYYEKSYVLNRNFTDSLYASARLVHARDGEPQLLVLLDQRIDEQGGKHQLLRAHILFEEHLYKEAKDAAESAWRSSLSQRDAAMMVIADSMLMMGSPKDAILSFGKISEQSPLYVLALLRTCLAYWILSDWLKAKEYLTHLQSHPSYPGSPYAAMYMAIHHFLSGEQEAVIDLGEQDFIKIEEEFKNIIRCFLQSNRMDLIEALIPLLENKRYLYTALCELFYEYGQYSYVDRFAFKVLEYDPEHEKMGLLFMRSKKKQKKEYEAAQWLSLYLGHTMTSPQRYIQYIDILREWALTITSMGIRDYPLDESLKRYYQAAKELQLG
ncbi:hypothetical protein PaeBR_12815 [Paenibacillus sp. BR2-3]|uniref:tetratricopeptide repeat-containing glycosyltransferase n=1 Tax=Paenibacillus sp. BR2-3 TaxID=3048494 RepID=UPI0039776F95